MNKAIGYVRTTDGESISESGRQQFQEVVYYAQSKGYDLLETLHDNNPSMAERPALHEAATKAREAGAVLLVCWPHLLAGVNDPAELLAGVPVEFINCPM